MFRNMASLFPFFLFPLNNYPKTKRLCFYMAKRLHVLLGPEKTIYVRTLCEDCMLRSPSLTTYWAQHGNVEFRGLDPVKPSAMSSNFILSASSEVKLELEIHLVSSVSVVEFKAECACCCTKSSQIRPRTPNVVYDSGASHLKFLSVNISTSHRCINVVFDYQLFLRTITMGSKVELLFGLLHFVEHDSPLNGFIFCCFVLSFSFVLLSSMASSSSASVVNLVVH